MSVRVRFAPSPTGFLHVGGARTAIFNWLLARHVGGTFVLRIEDTDLERSSAEVVAAILEGMAWLGMTPDEGPYFQTEARDRHASDARSLVTSGHAYRCFCDAEALRREREEAERRGEGYVYPRRCRVVSAGESERRSAAGESFVVRLAVPDGQVAWNDLVHGPTSFAGSLLEDLILLRSDGSPTYNLSVVSDDLAMRITHVIRGDDHLSNTPKQIVIYRALGREPPRFAHLPLILGADRKRLSKRHGATSVLEYRDRGYLPDAVFNFLALLGWSPGDDRQRMSRAELIEAFDLSGVGTAGATFDLQKLDWLNGQYLSRLPLDDVAAEVERRVRAAGLWDEAWTGERRAWFRRLVSLLQPRLKAFEEAVELARPYLDPSDELPYDPDAERRHLAGEGLAAGMRDLGGRLSALESWTAGPLEAALREAAGAAGIPAGRLIHATRLAVTGRGASPGIFEVLEVVGRERSLARLDRLIRRLDEAGAR